MRERQERECEIDFRDRDWENVREKKGKRERESGAKNRIISGRKKG